MSASYWTWGWKLMAFEGSNATSSRTHTFATLTGLLWMAMLSTHDQKSMTELTLVPGLCGTLMLLATMPRDGGSASRQRAPRTQGFLRESKRFSRRSNSSQLRKLHRIGRLKSLRPGKLHRRDGATSSPPERPTSRSHILMQAVIRLPYSRQRTTTSIFSSVLAPLNGR